MIPLHRPTRAPAEADLVGSALRPPAGQHEAHYADECVRLLKRELGSPYVTVTPSCTAALELAAVVLGVGPGDEVIVPAYTFPSTANAFLLRGARIVFADVSETTLCLDPADVERRVTPNTRAIVAMHYAGIPCDMARLSAVARAAGASLVEDAAHALFGADVDGRPLGTIGDIGAFSFHRSKNLTCGEGGAFVANAPAHAEAAEIVREKGTNRTQFMRGELSKYEWVREGMSAVLAELLAAQLLAQLRAAQDIQARRKAIWRRYQAELAGWAAREGVRQPYVPDGCEPAWHLYHLVMPSPGDRDRLLDHLHAQGIGAAFHYVALHLSPFGRSLGGAAGDAPISEWAAARLVRLPFYTDLSEDDQDRVIAAVHGFTSAAGRPVRPGAPGTDAALPAGGSAFTTHVRRAR